MCMSVTNANSIFAWIVIYLLMKFSIHVLDVPVLEVYKLYRPLLGWGDSFDNLERKINDFVHNYFFVLSFRREPSDCWIV